MTTVRRQWDDGRSQDYVAETTAIKDPAVRAMKAGKAAMVAKLAERSTRVKGEGMTKWIRKGKGYEERDRGILSNAPGPARLVQKNQTETRMMKDLGRPVFGYEPDSGHNTRSGGDKLPHEAAETKRGRKR